jgi:transposase
MGLREGILERLHPEAQAYIAELEEHNHRLETRYDHLKEEYRLLVYKGFSRSSEQIDPSQEELFGEAEESAEQTPTATESTTVATHQRKRPGRKPLDANLPRVEILHDIADEEKQCACGHELVRIGEETSERLQVIPEQIWVERHVRPKYACHHCEGSGDEQRPAVRIAPAEPSVIPASIVTPGLLSFILVNKFCDHLPFYRQETRFKRLGIHISRQDMSNWTIGAARRLSPRVG